MASGIFLIGDGLSPQGFETFAQPLILEKFYVLSDVHYLGKAYSTQKVLVAIKGEGDIRLELSDLLVTAGERADEDFKAKQGNNFIATKYQLLDSTNHYEQGKLIHTTYFGKFETIGVYAEDFTASQLFSGVAQEYVASYAQNELHSLERTVKRLLSKKLSDL